MNIGEAAKESGVSAKMIRHYESIGLIKAAHRSDAGYRHYAMQDLDTLRFIRRSRDLGFSLDQINTLLSLWREQSRSSAEVKKLAAQHLAELEEKMAALREMSDKLRLLINQCNGNDDPDCAIIETLAGSTPNSHCCASPKQLD
ncbi:Cu(I)-responsive transcriptional regulator [Bartonella sp. HY406]|uniref:Cu(I)-responsive transcriptional regulator n=1 Tax=Bartonella sp. HY406 TaxID=2979331 RepID=UPI0021CAA3E4|nr:Cu(I)-responsive transcriptional regulator [Bartonella sp. HY406]UXN02643.1 Cu(I)-responsive transcriptional regulator [Bartonella sp. HY406]